MTVGIAWIATRPDGREHLYFASDSRVTGGYRMDACPKILTLPRSDCALCFAGTTEAAYPLMLQIAQAIAAHQPSRERGMDIGQLKEHLLRLCSNLIGRFRDAAAPFSNREVQFLFGGYSWRSRDFRIWTFEYAERERRFTAREAVSFHLRIRKAAFIGDYSKVFRGALIRDLNSGSKRPAHLEPLRVLAMALRDAKPADTIGGPPQVVRITLHMNTRPLCVQWNGEVTLFGRPLFPYENVDYWVVDPFGGAISLPRKFGRRDALAPAAVAPVDEPPGGDPVDA